MYSTWLAISLIRLPKVPEPEAGWESRTRIRVAIPSSRSTSRSTTTAYRPSLPPKCSYTTGLDTPACAAISSMEVPSRPRSANSLRPMSSSCCLRSLPVILFRLGPAGWLVTTPSWRSAGNSANRVSHPGRRPVVIEPSLRALPVCLADSRCSSGQRTSYAQPSFSASQMPRAAMSIWPLSTPCLAQVGSAWCRLCQDSPKDRIASQETFLDLSLTSNSSLPKVWQIELIDQVMWGRRATRTRLAQKNAVTAPCHDIDHSPPIRAGASRDAVTSHSNQRETLEISESASQSGQNFSADVTSPSNSQPIWAKARPFRSAFQSFPKRHGECGSPSLSLYLWCLR